MFVVGSFVRMFVASSFRPSMGRDGPSFEEGGGAGRHACSKIERDERGASGVTCIFYLRPEVFGHKQGG